MLMRLPVIMLTSLPFTSVPNSVPKFDIARECRAEGGSNATLEKCAGDETQARAQLEQEWSQFGASDKRTCIQETSMDGTPSYVELLICLEMARDAKKAGE